ncbi:MAG: EAL domain-containing protein [Acidimicrobiia bacterium]
MLEHATDGICLVSREGTILATTPAIERMIGAAPGSMREMSGLDLLHEDDVLPALDRLNRIGEDVPDDYRTYRFKHRDGHYITVELLATENPEPIAEAPTGSLVLTVRDITEWHETQLELAQSQIRRDLVANIASSFVDALDTEIDATVTTTLERLGHHMGADRAYVFRSPPEGMSMHCTHRWARRGRGFIVDLFVDIPTGRLQHWRDQLLANQTVLIDDRTEPDSQNRDIELTGVAGISALVAVPLVREGVAVGFIGLDVIDRSHVWSHDDTLVLRVVSDIIGSALARRDAGERSRLAETRFRAMVEHSSDALIVIDGDAQISHMPIGENLFGYAPEDLYATNALDLVHPDDLDFASTEMIKAVVDPTYHALNAMRIRHADGHWVPIELVASSHFDEPAIDGVIMNVRDVTERRLVESRLHESEERMRALVANLPGAVFRCGAEPPYDDDYVSDAIAALTGYSAAAFLAGEISFDALIEPEHRAATDIEIARAKASPGDRQYVVEYPLRHRDGSIRWLSEHGRIVKAEPGSEEMLEGFIFDITSRVEAINETKDSDAKLTHLIANIPGAVFRSEATPPYRDIFVSDAIEELTGYTPTAFLDGEIDFYDLIVADQRDNVDAPIARSTETGNAYTAEYQFRHRDGSLRWVEERGQVAVDPDGSTWIDGAMFDLTQRKLLEDQLEHDAAHDPLTGLPNRNLLIRHLEATVMRGQRTGALTAALFVDLDRFKLVNDALGHTAGDELLVHFSRRLLSVLRASDLAARTGGDEFVIVCSDLADVSEAEAVADRVAELLRNPFTIQGRSVFVSASVGIALADRHDSSASDLLRNADTAAYRAKDRGRNRYELFDDALRAATAAALEIETDLHRALDDHQLFLRYQPVVDIEHGKMVGAEGLVRWQHPRRGLLAPDDFLAAAEVSGLVVALGREVLELGVGAMRDIDETRLPTLALNLSPRELAQPDLIERVRITLAEHGVKPSRLCIEITESAVLDEVESAIATLNALRDIGVRLAIDDFGTGYSSLSYLRRLPVDIVKIDRSFVAELGADGANLTIVAGIIGLARGLGLSVVAEGIETVRQLQVLRELGCTLGQGYLFSAPIALDDLLGINPDRWSTGRVRH